jgi:hypothetical protein
MKKSILAIFSILFLVLVLGAAVDNTKARELIDKGYYEFQVYKNSSKALSYYKQAIDLSSGYTKSTALVRAAYMSHLLGNKISDYERLIKDALVIDSEIKLEPIDFGDSFRKVFDEIKSGGGTIVKPSVSEPSPKPAPLKPEPAKAKPVDVKPTPLPEVAPPKPKVTSPTEELTPTERKPSEIFVKKPETPNRKIGFKIAAGLALPAGSSLNWEGSCGVGPGFHISVFYKVKEQIELTSGIELFLFSNKKWEHYYFDDEISDSEIIGYGYSSGNNTFNIFAAGRYLLNQSKLFFEGGFGYYVNKHTTDYSFWGVNEPAVKFSDGQLGLRIGCGYKITNFLETEICANIAGRTTVFIMIGFKK